jgi:hypothetical protein
MSPSQPDYSKVFNRLCHMIALTREGKTAHCIDNLVSTLYVIDDSFAPTSVQEVMEAIEVYFGLPLTMTDIQASLDRHQSHGTILYDAVTHAYSISIQFKAEIATKIGKASQLEDFVREQWLSSLEPILKDVLYTVKDKLWNCLRTYMGKAFQRHGVETIQLLRNIKFEGTAEFKTLSTYLVEATSELEGYISSDLASECIRIFFRTSTPERTKYVAQLLDGTFTFFALANDKATTEFLGQSISPLSLFLDTNFIFGIMDLHVNPLVDVSKELLEVIKACNLPFKLYYHKETLAEIRRTISSIGYRLKMHHWQQSISRAAVRNGQVSGLELRYHEQNSRTPLDPSVFLSKYDGITELLEEKGFEIYSDPLSTDPNETFEKGKLIAEYDEYIKQRRPNRPKPYEALNHDMAVWRTVHRLRHDGVSVLNAGSLFLTADFHLYAFDWQRLREAGSLGIVVLPNQFLQLLRPFIPSTEDFDRRFVETFAIPEFRIVGSDYAATCSKVLAYINTYKDIGEATAVRILANHMLIEQLRGIEEDSVDFKEQIENALARDNENLLEEREALLAEKGLTEKRVKALEEKAKKDHETILNIESRAKEAELKAQKAEEYLKNEKEKLRSIIRKILGITVGLVGIIAILLIPYIISWPWLANHPNRLGLYGCTILILIGVSWTIADEKHLKYSLGAVALGALLVLLQILGK